MRDRQQYESILQGFVGQVCYRTIACNSIKLRFEEGKKITDRGYIWIDPPWSFLHHQRVMTNSGCCPHYEDADYEPGFQAWCDLFTPLNQTLLTRYEFASDKSLNLFFSNAYQIYVPEVEEVPDDLDLWYSHWYATLKTQA